MGVAIARGDRLCLRRDTTLRDNLTGQPGVALTGDLSTWRREKSVYFSPRSIGLMFAPEDDAVFVLNGHFLHPRAIDSVRAAIMLSLDDDRPNRP